MMVKFSGKQRLECNKQRLVYLESIKKESKKDINSDFCFFLLLLSIHKVPID